ncbi:hypothetical protein [uncultured Sneathiella sp.]|mgnify:FL=1|jgi:hypothetical protein|uniref:hypothetical protein n=1 Tax=uncultured Sneathiella sp. TaxID=879315 RepID=UPI0030DD7015|tara:strand:+ start:501 stop:1007 length:507 start_codon:yes stop_codon:yes gene_type:complete
MSLPELRKGFTNTAAAMGMTAIAAMAPLSYSFADETRSVQVVPAVATSVVHENALEAQRAALKYVEETGGLGIVIGYGTYEGAADPEQLGQLFQQKIAERGAESQYFIGTISKPGFSLAFYNGHTVEGPMPPQEAASSLTDLVGQHLFYKRQFSSLNTDVSPNTAALD